MPVTLPLRLHRLTAEEFRRLDYEVMRHAFDCHNALGRLCEEDIYRNDLVGRLEAAGLGPVRKEFPLSVVHRGFEKVYFIDLVVQQAVIYESKAVAQLVDEHRMQLLNYLLLCEQPRGKLVNFRPPSVEQEFVNTTLTDAERRRFTVHGQRWRELSDRCGWLRQTFIDLLEDWGAFLEIALYQEALTYFLGGPEAVAVRIPLSRAAMPLGLQTVHLLTPYVAFRITAFTARQAQYESHLQRLLAHTELKAIQWMNLNHHDIELVTVAK